MKGLIIFTILAAGISMTGCKKNDNSADPGAQPTMSYRLAASNTSYAVAKTTASADIQWSSAYAYPGTIKFEAKQDNIEVEFKSTGNGRIDLLSPVAYTFGNFTLPPGTYDEIELKIELDRDGNNPVLELNGQFTTTTLSVPVHIAVTRSVELKTEQHNIVIATGEDYTAVTTLDLATLTSGIDSDMLLDARLTNGVIDISATSNTSLYNLIVDNLTHRHHHCDFEHHHRH